MRVLLKNTTSQIFRECEDFNPIHLVLNKHLLMQQFSLYFCTEVRTKASEKFRCALNSCLDCCSEQPKKIFENGKSPAKYVRIKTASVVFSFFPTSFLRGLMVYERKEMMS